ncbi:MAG: T9SS type A sorting domain-containing protein [Phycisphaerales bacterium]|nr:T9SS type A sorting domain-containing protein [Phycisphaerales bacterium]
MKKIFTSTLLLTLFLTAKLSHAVGPLSGAYTIPAPGWITLAQIIDSLNYYGVNGPVTITMKQNEIAPSGGYVLGSDTLNNSLTKSASAARSITITGFGAGGRTLYANVGTGSTDAIFTFKGVDFVTVDKLHLKDTATNTTATTMMERGYSVVKFTADQGCNTISIINCNITMNNTNTTAASGISPLGATGIYVGNCLIGSTTATAAPVFAAGAHNGIFIFQNYITNTNQGVYVFGNQLNTDGTAYNDQGATIQSNTITNFTDYGVFLSNFNGDLVKGNTINNLTDGGAAPTVKNIFGIRYANTSSFVSNTSWTAANNNIKLTIGSTDTYMATGISTQLNGTGTTDINNDTVELVSTGASAQLNGIFCQNNGGTETITNNLLRNFTTQTTNTQAVIGAFLGGYSTYPTLGLFNPSYYPATVNFSGNTITGFNVASGRVIPINSNHRVTAILDDNFSTSPCTVSNNTISNINIINGSHRFVGYGAIGNAAASVPILHTTTLSGNTFSNIQTLSATDSTSIAIIAPAGTYPNGHTLNLTNNKIKNITSKFGSLMGISLDFGLQANLDKDTLTDFTTNSYTFLIGISSGVGSGSYAMKNISISNCLLKNFKGGGSSLANSQVTGIYCQAASVVSVSSLLVSNNLLQNITNTDTLGTAFGINLPNGTPTTIFSNNIISDISAALDTTRACSSFGINLNANGNNSVLYNTVNMISATTPGNGYGSTALGFNAAGINAIHNNILRANVVAGTTNNVAAIRGSAGSASAAPSVAGFTASSNIYFAPTGPNNYLYVEGTTASTLVNGYAVSGLTPNPTKNIVNDTFFNSFCNSSSYHRFMQTSIASREQKTFTENNISGTGGVFSPSGMSYAESNATDVAVTTDFISASRPAGNSDIGALEFGGTMIPTMNITITSSTGLDTACTFKLPVLTATIPTSFNRVSFQWFKDTAKVVGATTKTLAVGSTTANYIFKVYDSLTGCTYSSNPFRMNIVPPPPAFITYYDSLIFCEGSAVVLHANVGSSYTYQWWLNSSILPGEIRDYYVASKSGDYTVAVNTPLGCETYSTAIRIKVYPLPTPVIIYGGGRWLTTSQKFYLYQWYLNGVKIDSFATARSYYTFTDGAYTVEVTDSNGCTSKSDVYLYSLGINDPSIAASIKLYPNPTTDVLHIESPIALMIRLTDLVGRTLLEHANTNSIDMSNLAEGVYLLNMIDKEGNLIKVEKIMKTK